MNDSELGLELAEIVRKAQEEATMLHREQKDVAKTDIPKRHKIDWDALTDNPNKLVVETNDPSRRRPDCRWHLILGFCS